MTGNEAVPKEVSERVLHAIQGALREEKIPASRRWLKILLLSTTLTIVFLIPLLIMTRNELNRDLVIASILWWLCFILGFFLYFYPQPRLAVAGFWSKWVFAKVLIAMTFLTCLEILVCPSFVFLHSDALAWNAFAPLTDLFMQWGGMRVCMFGCGFLFAGLGATLTFSFITKIISKSASRDLLRAGALALLSHIPIMTLQILDMNLRAFVPFWILGSIFGILIGVITVRAATSFVFAKR
ncbi:MAG: hypothetical protein AB7F66_09080 [Bacteriovoracia bacterium]